MSTDNFALLCSVSMVLTVALLLVLVLRRLAAGFLHPHARYALWLALPLALLVWALPLAKEPIFPAISAPVATLRLTLLVNSSFPNAPTATTSFKLAMGLWVLGFGCAAAWYGWRYRMAWQQANSAAGPSSACVVGVWRPRVFLPKHFQVQFDTTQQALIIAHEQFHIRRFDPLCNALMHLLHCAFWFHPLLPLALRAYRADQELSCDAAVVSSLQNKQPKLLADQTSLVSVYAETLVQSATAHMTSHDVVQCQWRPVHPLLERIEMLKQVKNLRYSKSIGAAMLVLVLGGAAIVSQAIAASLQPGSTMPTQLASAATATNQTVGKIVFMTFEIRRNGQIIGTPSVAIEVGSTGSVSVESDDPAQPNSAQPNRAEPLRRQPSYSISFKPELQGDLTRIHLRTEISRADGVLREDFAIGIDGTGGFKTKDSINNDIYEVEVSARVLGANESLPPTAKR
jgi:beta-lactamase regulating signal transducer with metallopeptidase domain